MTNILVPFAVIAMVVALIGLGLLVLHVRTQLPHRAPIADRNENRTNAEETLQTSLRHASSLQRDLELIRARRKRDEQ